MVTNATGNRPTLAPSQTSAIVTPEIISVEQPVSTPVENSDEAPRTPKIKRGRPKKETEV